MRLQVLNAVILVAFASLGSTDSVCGFQELAPISINASNQLVQKQAAVANQKPYRLSSRIHIQKGTTKGYLIVQVDLKKGSYIYSLTQPGDVPPSKLTVGRSPNFRLLGDFSPDQPATIVEKDPVMDQRVEKHKNSIQFFAPIEMAPGIDQTKVVASVTFDGQVCSDQGFCMPVRNINLVTKFGGYFERTAAKPAVPNQGTQPGIGGTPTNAGTIRR